jgi:hypothetical protein
MIIVIVIPALNSVFFILYELDFSFRLILNVVLTQIENNTFTRFAGLHFLIYNNRNLTFYLILIGLTLNHSNLKLTFSWSLNHLSNLFLSLYHFFQWDLSQLLLSSIEYPNHLLKINPNFISIFQLSLFFQFHQNSLMSHKAAILILHCF